MNLVEETRIDHSLSPSSSNSDDIFGDPDVFPHLGDEYQVEIPKLEPLHLQNTTINHVDTINFSSCTGEEFAIPVRWLHRVDSDKILNSKYNTVPGVSLDDLDSNQSLPPGYVPLPESSVAFWSDVESESFLLGLYIFGKNLVQVQKFVESKEMGDILFFYYGKFYRSDDHRRWVECRKMRSRKCIFGHRIFTGSRQQEILSRLLPSRSKEVKDTMLEATKAFNEGSTSLEDFIFTLKSIVGKESLVQAVGIGKGKRDLTGILPDPGRSNLVVPTRPEIPVGKACSSLTLEEIVKFLTGDFRLSKAKSNDLFWEAVWPRLLARGWHSEQPKDVSSFTSKNGLVFLVPGIKKFSRRKLTKGTHYFDSVTDVLNKVASDPELLEFEADEAKESEEAAADKLLVQNGSSSHQRTCYLRPRQPDCNSEFIKFTVVDTSLFPGVVRELKSLPVNANSRYHCPFNRLRETNSEDSSNEQSSSLNSLGESDQSPFDDKKTGNVQTSSSDHLNTDLKQSFPIHGNDLDKQSLKDIKHQFRRRVKSDKKIPLAPVYKRRRLTACSKSSVPTDYEELKKEEHFQMESIENSSKANVADEAVLSQETHRQRALIDLNSKPQDFDTEEPSAMEGDLKPISHFFKTKQHHEGDSSQACAADEQHASVMKGRRQSTRNRPPTAKALEAVACGFLSVKKGRSMKPSRSSSRRAHKNNADESSASLPDPTTVSPSVGTMDEYYRRTTDHTSYFDDSHLPSERKEKKLELFGVP